MEEIFASPVFRVANIAAIALFFFLGILRCTKASRLLRKTETDVDFDRHLNGRPSVSGDDLSLIAAKHVYRAYEEYQENAYYPESFLEQAAERFVEHYFESKHLDKISTYSNLLPPLGFLGTVAGMIGVFFSGGDLSRASNQEGLATALYSTLVALSCYSILEVVRIRLESSAPAVVERGLDVGRRAAEQAFRSDTK